MRRSLVVAFVLVLFGLGCGSSKSYLKSSEFQESSSRVKNVGVVVADARIYRLRAGGEAEVDVDASAQCLKCLEAAAVNELAAKGFAAAALPMDDDLRTLLGQYINVRGDIESPFAPNQGTIEGLPRLPGAVAVLTRAKVDAIVFVGGVDHIATAGRKVLMAIVTGGGYQGGIGYADLALLDGSGTLIFYDRRKGTDFKLTNDSDVSRVCSKFVANLTAERK